MTELQWLLKCRTPPVTVALTASGAMVGKEYFVANRPRHIALPQPTGPGVHLVDLPPLGIGRSTDAMPRQKRALRRSKSNRPRNASASKPPAVTFKADSTNVGQRWGAQGVHLRMTHLAWSLLVGAVALAAVACFALVVVVR